jgi:hypothetical protein
MSLRNLEELYKCLKNKGAGLLTDLSAEPDAESLKADC